MHLESLWVWNIKFSPPRPTLRTSLCTSRLGFLLSWLLFFFRRWVFSKLMVPVCGHVQTAIFSSGELALWRLSTWCQGCEYSVQDNQSIGEYYSHVPSYVLFPKHITIALSRPTTYGMYFYRHFISHWNLQHLSLIYSYFPNVYDKGSRAMSSFINFSSLDISLLHIYPIWFRGFATSSSEGWGPVKWMSCPNQYPRILFCQDEWGKALISHPGLLGGSSCTRSGVVRQISISIPNWKPRTLSWKISPHLFPQYYDTENVVFKVEIICDSLPIPSRAWLTNILLFNT